MEDILKVMKTIVWSLILILSVLIITGFILDIHDKNEREKYLQSDEYKQLIEKQEKCEHNFVTTGSGKGRGLKIYSKCSKCGKTIK